MISAWVAEHQIVLGQEKTSVQSNEKTAIPDLLASLDLKDALISCDAANCQLKNTVLIVGKQGHYLIALKKDHKHIYEQVSERMQKNKVALPRDEWVDFGSVRIKKRVCYIENQLDLLDDLGEWKHLRTVVMIDSSREKHGKTTSEIRYYLSDLAATAQQFNYFIGKHWSIENRLHWKLDVVFREDVARTKSENAAENLAIARKMALQMLNQRSDKESIKNRRKIAGWDDDYLRNILTKINLF